MQEVETTAKQRSSSEREIVLGEEGVRALGPMKSTHLDIAVLAPFRFPISEPFTGGLEAHVWLTCRMLRERGHRVTLIAAAGSDLRIADDHYSIPALIPTGGQRHDISSDGALVRAEAQAYRSALEYLAGASFDVVHNHSLHALPIAGAGELPMPMVTTLHTPPLEQMVAAFAAEPDPRMRCVAVSRHTADAWAERGIVSQVVHNGVDTARWQRGPGGRSLIWFGRLVPEKGPELAIDAARLAGRDIALAGPIVDQAFYDSEIASRLGPGVRYLGHLDQQELAVAVGRSSVALATPTWDEPYGLVVAEALSCGTPVAAFRRGGIPEILTPDCGRMAAPGDVPALAEAIRHAATLHRGAARRRAVRHCSASTMSRAYDDVYREQLVAGRPIRARGAASVPA